MIMTVHDALHQARRNYASPRGPTGPRLSQPASALGGGGGPQQSTNTSLACHLPQRPGSAPSVSPTGSLPLGADGEDDFLPLPPATSSVGSSLCDDGGGCGTSSRTVSSPHAANCGGDEHGGSEEGSVHQHRHWGGHDGSSGGGRGAAGTANRPLADGGGGPVLPLAADGSACRLSSGGSSGAIRAGPPWPRGRGQDASSAGSFSGFYPGSWDSGPSAAAPTPNSSWLGISQLDEQHRQLEGDDGGAGDCSGMGGDDVNGEDGEETTKKHHSRDGGSRRQSGEQPHKRGLQMISAAKHVLPFSAADGLTINEGRTQAAATKQKTCAAIAGVCSPPRTPLQQQQPAANGLATPSPASATPGSSIRGSGSDTSSSSAASAAPSALPAARLPPLSAEAMRGRSMPTIGAAHAAPAAAQAAAAKKALYTEFGGRPSG